MKFLTSLLVLPALALATKPKPEEISIKAVTHSGNGCPQGSTATSINEDRTVLTVGFDRFQTYIGPGTSFADRSKNCQLHITLEYPSGFSFAVVDSVYHGFALLEEGVRGDFLSTYFFSSDAAADWTTRTSIDGGGIWAEGQVYTQRDAVPAADVVRSPCGGRTAQLNINNRVSLRSNDPKASGMISNDDQTLALTQQIHIDWFEC
ncbi:hypothetical protein VUR80DRAFT_8467 [Thermomyces stellatus]